jgi:hypothetical protein
VGDWWGKEKMETPHEEVDSKQSKFTHLFQIIVIIINFLQRRCMDFTYEVVRDQNPNLATHGWEGEF